MQPPPRFLEFFAGAGLVRRALEPDWNCAWANDVSAKKAEVYRANFRAGGFVEQDIALVSAKMLPGAAMAWASFPCQDLSLAGWRRGMSASRSGTFWAFWRLMADLKKSGRRPPVVVIENVVGMLYGDNFVGLCEAVAALGMKFGALVVDARHFLPQSRPRVFVVAVDETADVKDLVFKNCPPSPWSPSAVRAAFSVLSPQLAKRWVWWALPTPQQAPLGLERVIEEAVTSGWRSEDETHRLLSMMSDVNRQKVEARKNERQVSVGFLYRRMREGRQRPEVRFDIAGCLRTPTGGSSRQTVVLAGQGKVRMRLVTPREAARLMGVDDEFVLPENYNDAYRAMGDGVAVPVVKWLSDHLLLKLATGRRIAASPRVGSSVGVYLERSRARASRWLSVAQS